MRRLLDSIYSGMAWLAMLGLAAAFVVIGLGVLARQLSWDLQGLDGYAGYAIAAALFLALPATFQRNEHIRVTLLMEKVPASWRNALQVSNGIDGQTEHPTLCAKNQHLAGRRAGYLGIHPALKADQGNDLPAVRKNTFQN